MKQLFLSLFFFFAFIGISFAQQEINNCFNYRKAGDYQRAIDAGKKAVNLYPKNMDAHYCLGDSYRLVGEFNLAIQSMKEAERLTVERLTVRKNELTRIYNRMGLIFERLGDLDNALFYNSKYLNLAKELGDKRGEDAALSNIAGIFYRKGEIDKALSYHEESLRVNTDEEDKSSTYNDIALIYCKKGDYQKAIPHLKKAVEIDERYGNYHGLAITLLNLGDTYRNAKDFKQAEENLQEGLKRILKVGDKYGEAIAYKYLGALYRDKGNIKNAKEYLTKAYNLFELIGAKAESQDALSLINNVKEIKETPQKSK